jgi:hypothetical protein
MRKQHADRADQPGGGEQGSLSPRRHSGRQRSDGKSSLLPGGPVHAHSVGIGPPTTPRDAIGRPRGIDTSQTLRKAAYRLLARGSNTSDNTPVTPFPQHSFDLFVSSLIAGIGRVLRRGGSRRRGRRA